jgi:hypothetical protein
MHRFRSQKMTIPKNKNKEGSLSEMEKDPLTLLAAIANSQVYGILDVAVDAAPPQPQRAPLVEDMLFAAM